MGGKYKGGEYLVCLDPHPYPSPTALLWERGFWGGFRGGLWEGVLSTSRQHEAFAVEDGVGGPALEDAAGEGGPGAFGF